MNRGNAYIYLLPIHVLYAFYNLHAFKNKRFLLRLKRDCRSVLYIENN